MAIKEVTNSSPSTFVGTNSNSSRRETGQVATNIVTAQVQSDAVINNVKASNLKSDKIVRASDLAPIEDFYEAKEVAEDLAQNLLEEDQINPQDHHGIEVSNLKRVDI